MCINYTTTRNATDDHLYKRKCLIAVLLFENDVSSLITGTL